MTEPTPFSSAPARPSAEDPPPPVDIAAAYFGHRDEIAADGRLLLELLSVIGRPADLSPSQAAQWFATVLEFRPDLIIELGRGTGNSTAVFCQAVHRLGSGRITSFDLRPGWPAADRIAERVPAGWLGPLDAVGTDIVQADLVSAAKDAERIFVLWDAHGFEVAEAVLGVLLPAIAERTHLIVVHDISDNRYSATTRSYTAPMWKGSAWQAATGNWDSRINCGWMTSEQDEMLALADFAVRNDLDIGSADHEYHRYFAADDDRRSAMLDVVGPELFSMTGHWAFFSLTGKQGPFAYPPPPIGSSGLTLSRRVRLRLARMLSDG